MGSFTHNELSWGTGNFCDQALQHLGEINSALMSDHFHVILEEQTPGTHLTEKKNHLHYKLSSPQ
jgi:hypothetical protein